MERRTKRANRCIIAVLLFSLVFQMQPFLPEREIEIDEEWKLPDQIIIIKQHTARATSHSSTHDFSLCFQQE